MVLLPGCPCCGQLCCNWIVLNLRPTLDLVVSATEQDIAAGASVWLDAAAPGDPQRPLRNGILTLQNQNGSTPSFFLETSGGLQASVRAGNGLTFSLTDQNGNYGFAGLATGLPAQECGDFCGLRYGGTLYFYDPNEPPPDPRVSAESSNYVYRLIVETRACVSPLDDIFGFQVGDTFTMTIEGMSGCGCYRGQLSQPGTGINGTLCLEYVGGNRFINRGSLGTDWPAPTTSPAAVLVHYYPRRNMPDGDPSNQVFVVEFQLAIAGYTINDSSFSIGEVGTFGFFLGDNCNLLSVTNYEDVLEQSADEREQIAFKEIRWGMANAQFFQSRDAFGELAPEFTYDASQAVITLRKEECTPPTRNAGAPHYWAFTPIGRSSADFPPPQTATVTVTLSDPAALLTESEADCGSNLFTAGQAFDGEWELEIAVGRSQFSGERELADCRPSFNRTPTTSMTIYVSRSAGVNFDPFNLIRFVPEDGNPLGWALVIRADFGRALLYLAGNFSPFPEDFVFDGTYELEGKFWAVYGGFANTEPQDATATVTFNQGLP